MKNISRLILFVGLCELVGFLGSLVVTPSIHNWYRFLQKPPLLPPDWVFAPVWITLYLFMGIAAYQVWEKKAENKFAEGALTLFFFQLVLNFSWSFLFFGLHALLISSIEIVILWLSIFLTVKKFYRVEKNSAYLLIPYIVWVSFSVYLNFFTYLLNR